MFGPPSPVKRNVRRAFMGVLVRTSLSDGIPQASKIEYNDAIFTYIIDGGAVSEIPVEFLVDAYLQDGKWYQ